MDGSNPHFLHERGAITAVLQPPVEGARALSWLGRREQLLVATQDGSLIEVDPVYGTRKLKGTVQDPARICASPDGKLLAVVERGIGIAIHETRKGERLAEMPLPLLSEIELLWFPRPHDQLGLVVLGRSLDGRLGVVTTPELGRRKRLRLPDQVVLGQDARGHMVYARVLPGGLELVPFGKPLPRAHTSAHRLRYCGKGLLMGLAEGGVTVWKGKDSQTVMSYDLTAADVHVVGEMVALGTRSGEIAFSRLSDGSVTRGRPGKVAGHQQAVKQVAFSPSGPWLASCADGVRLWRW